MVTIANAPGYRPMRGTADMRAIVFQSGWLVTLNATITWPGELPETVWDGMTGTIDREGVWHGNPPRTAVDAECGRVDFTERLIRFRALALVYRQQAETEDCGRFDWRATLARERRGNDDCSRHTLLVSLGWQSGSRKSRTTGLPA